MSDFERNETSKHFKVGDRVELHPALDRWMMGDRYGTIATGARPGTVPITLDKSGNTLWFKPGDFMHATTNCSCRGVEVLP